MGQSEGASNTTENNNTFIGFNANGAAGISNATAIGANATRLALARYEALTIMTLMGHKDLKMTMRYSRAVQLQREVPPEQVVNKFATNEIRPPALAAVSY